MALSRITINHSLIRSTMASAPFAGSAFGERRGFSHGSAVALAERMALVARINASRMFNQRTGSLVSSVVPIVRPGLAGSTIVGVATTVEHGKWLEKGTEPHIIRPQGTGYLLRSDGPNSKGGNPDPLERPQAMVQAPALNATHWLSNAVREVAPGLPVVVTYFP